jgi:glycosyltransferase involved in cell wall biosynthesis
MTILINTPFIKSPAGVSNHYLGLRPYFSKKVVYNQYITLNYIRRKIKYKFLHKTLRSITLLYDLLKFTFLLIIYRKPTVLLNPSFDSNALRRDVIFLIIALFIGCKVAVFLHGWNMEYFKTVSINKNNFNKHWKKANAFFVLAKEFKSNLENLNIISPIFLTTTKVNDSMLVHKEKKEIESICNILFLARIEMEKGIKIVIDTFELLNKKYSPLKLRVVGSGNMLDEVRKYAKEKGIHNIVFTGPQFGEDLILEYSSADLYILPTYGEGMPTTVLEAMAFGLPIITRPVGGLVDFFENDKMGYLIESLDPKDYANVVEKMINDISKVRTISEYNKNYAQKHFLASKVASFLESKLEQLS